VEAGRLLDHSADQCSLDISGLMCYTMPALSHALGVVEGVAEISQGSTSTERK
jgi:hypothetical protein